MVHVQTIFLLQGRHTDRSDLHTTQYKKGVVMGIFISQMWGLVRVSTGYAGINAFVLLSVFQFLSLPKIVLGVNVALCRSVEVNVGLDLARIRHATEVKK